MCRVCRRPNISSFRVEVGYARPGSAGPMMHQRIAPQRLQTNGKIERFDPVGGIGLRPRRHERGPSAQPRAAVSSTPPGTAAATPHLPASQLLAAYPTWMG